MDWFYIFSLLYIFLNNQRLFAFIITPQDSLLCNPSRDYVRVVYPILFPQSKNIVIGYL